jgi:pilus assembly protein Flp/PilA
LGITNVALDTYSRIICCNSQTPERRGNPNEENQTMQTMRKLFTNLIADDSGQDLIEYALVAALVGLGAVAATGSLKSSILSTFHHMTSTTTVK